MKVSVMLTEGFETVEALAVIDILRRADIDTQIISLTGNIEVKSAQNITVKSDELFENINIDNTDIIFLPGGPGHKMYFEKKEMLDKLIEHNKKGKRIAAICAAPSVLGKLGILNGKKATCFPGYEDMLTGAEVMRAPERVVTDGNITTSRGMGTSLDLGLELVRLIKGNEIADKLAVSTQYI